MPYFKHNNYNYYYQVDGTNKEPLLFLNGVMMSSPSWDFAKEDILKEYNLIRFDFLDQGLSSSSNKYYSLNEQTKAVIALLDHLNIQTINVMGISYGGMVLCDLLANYSNRINKAILMNTCARTSPSLFAYGRSWNALGKHLVGEDFYNLTMSQIYSHDFFENAREFFDSRKEVLIKIFESKQFQDRLDRLVMSWKDFDVRSKLKDSKNDALIVGCECDALIPFSEQKIIHGILENSSLQFVENVGHGFMYEDSKKFIKIIMDYIRKNK